MIKLATVPACLLTMLSNYLFLAKKFVPRATERRGTLRSVPEHLYSHEKSEGSTADSISREVGAAATLRLQVCLCPCLLAEGLKREYGCTWQLLLLMGPLLLSRHQLCNWGKSLDYLRAFSCQWVAWDDQTQRTSRKIGEQHRHSVSSAGRTTMEWILNSWPRRPYPISQLGSVMAVLGCLFEYIWNDLQSRNE